jgi:hypothetical protein
MVGMKEVHRTRLIQGTAPELEKNTPIVVTLQGLCRALGAWRKVMVQRRKELTRKACWAAMLPVERTRVAATTTKLEDSWGSGKART